MSDSYSRCFDLTSRALNEGWSVEPAWREVVAIAGGKKPSVLWKKIAKISIAKDIERMAAWLEECHRKQPPPQSVKGYWFGLGQYSRGWVIELYGAQRYSIADDIDWAVNPVWRPRGSPFASSVLKDLSTLAARGDYEESSAIEMCGVFPYTALAIAAAIRRVDPLVLLGKAKSRGACCGFNDGDWLHLCVIEQKRVKAVSM